jgi:hypothetical protein
MTQSSNTDDREANRVIVLEGTPLGTPVAKSFADADEAEDFVIARVRANVLVDQRERFERAVADRIVSEDGNKAISEVIAGKLAFLRALAKAYAPTRITLTARRFDEDDDARR